MANLFHYTQNEKVDMLLIYGEYRKNSAQAALLYADRFPERNHPNRCHFSKIENKLRNMNDDDNENKYINEKTDIDILAFVDLHPTASTREIAHNSGISHQSVHNILKNISSIVIDINCINTCTKIIVLEEYNFAIWC